MSGNFSLRDFLSGNVIADINNVLKIKDDISNLKQKFGGILTEIIEDKGLFSGEILRGKFVEWIRRKTNADGLTFKKLKELAKVDGRFKELYVISYDLNSKSPIIYSAEHTPDVLISDAVYDSMAIPLFFKSKFNKVDGGIANNYPIALMRKLRQGTNFLGFRLVAPDLHAQYVHGQPSQNHAPVDFLTYITRLAEAFYLKQENDHAIGEDRERTVYIDTLDIGTLDFNMNPLNKRRLIDSGKNAAIHFINHRKQVEAVFRMDNVSRNDCVSDLSAIRSQKKYKLNGVNGLHDKEELQAPSSSSPTSSFFINVAQNDVAFESKIISSSINSSSSELNGRKRSMHHS
jgi:NTE family protein